MKPRPQTGKIPPKHGTTADLTNASRESIISPAQNEKKRRKDVCAMTGIILRGLLAVLVVLVFVQYIANRHYGR